MVEYTSFGEYSRSILEKGILEKDGATEKGAVEIEDKAPLHTYIGVSRKFYADLAYFHIVFW